MDTNTLIERIRKAIDIGNDSWLEDIIQDALDNSYENGVADTIKRFAAGIECADEEGETIGTVKYHHESGDKSVGIGDYECFILTELPCQDS